MDAKRKIRFGPYLLDEANECLWRNGEAIALRPKAYAVLRYLVAHPAVLVTKQQLLEVVWAETFVSDSVLKDSIRQLRDALGDDAKSPQFIETAHRRGYRFIAPLQEESQQTNPSAVSQPLAVPRFSPHHSVSEETPTGNMLGRADNLAQLQSWFEKTLNGQSQTIFVTGEAGIGKTTLVEAFLKDVSSKIEILVGRGQCLEQYGAGEAYLPVLDALSRLAREPAGQLVVEQLRLFAPSWLVQLPRLVVGAELQTLREQTWQVTRERMLREIAETIEAITAKAPFVLVLEDLHWSDYSTLDFISYMAHRRPPGSFMLIGTYRPVEVILNEHPLKGIKQELQMHRLAHELPLGYLDEDCVTDFLNNRFPENSFSSRLAGMIHRHTEGNPLFMVNVVEYLVDLNHIEEQNGKHVLTLPPDEIELGVPENIRHLIEKHIERLTETEQRILEGASVVGMDCSAVAIAAGLDTDVVRVEEVCDCLARRHQFLLPAYLAELPDGTITPRYRFIHALYLDVVYKRVAPTRRSQIHGRIGERGESIYGDGVGEIAAELAVHFEEARDLVRALKYLHVAAENAERRSANHEVISLARHGLELLETFPESAERSNNERMFAERISALKDRVGVGD
jgi:predicted ATPase/DNA-binding winged helix-turn-helix (wHTH) protein